MRLTRSGLGVDSWLLTFPCFARLRDSKPLRLQVCTAIVSSTLVSSRLATTAILRLVVAIAHNYSVPIWQAYWLKAAEPADACY